MTIPDSLKKLIGQPCCKVRVSIDKYLYLDFGKKLFASLEDTDDFKGEWELNTWSCTWRLVKDKDNVRWV